MLRSNRVLFYFLVTLGSVIVAVLLVFGIDRATNGSEILGTVTVGGVDLGGLGEFEATERVRALEAEISSIPIPVVVAGRTFALDPIAVGFEIDEQAIVDAAMRNGRDGFVFGQFGWWLGHFSGSAEDVEIPFTYDPAALAAVVEDWQSNGIDDPGSPGDVWVEDGRILYAYPRAGTGIEMDSAKASLSAVLAQVPRPTVELTTTRIVPSVTDDDIDAVVAQVEGLLAGPITLDAPELDRTITVPRRVLAEALSIRRDDATGNGQTKFDVTLLGEPIVGYVAAFYPYLETAPVDAQIIIDDVEDTVEIVPSLPVTEPDPVSIPLAAWAAANAPDRSAELTYRAGREAELSTEIVEAFGIKEKISEFTTYHACCQARVTNIQLIADAVDGAWILPGETFALNDWVGKRTVAKGYVCAGALIGGEVVQEGEICIGGGTSQFTTTMYNASFFAGLEDVYHFAHTIWFSRYPEGREATLGFPTPDLIFRNNTENVVVIKTSHTDTSITVKMFGDNGGIDVQAGLSSRYNFSSPRKETRADEDVPADCAYHKTQSGTPGWTVDVYRYITYPDGTQTTEVWTERYEGYWELTGYNPATPPDSVACTATTTTTGATTTTLSP
jgi:hypothetical protein